jgi:hypothetical protein
MESLTIKRSWNIVMKIQKTLISMSISNKNLKKMRMVKLLLLNLRKLCLVKRILLVQILALLNILPKSWTNMGQTSIEWRIYRALSIHYSLKPKMSIKPNFGYTQFSICCHIFVLCLLSKGVKREILPLFIVLHTLGLVIWWFGV